MEALRVLAKCEPALFREICDLAFATFEENRKNYHVTPDLSSIPNLKELPDKALCTLLDNVASRQVLHIAYGKILEREELKERLYRAIRKHRGEYSDMLYHHIGRHAQMLGVQRIGDVRIIEQHMSGTERDARTGEKCTQGISQCV